MPGWSSGPTSWPPRARPSSRRLQSEGLKRLGGPVVSVSWLAYAYNANLNLDLDPLNQKLGQIGQSLPPSIQSFIAATPRKADRKAA
ncbi:hypothetical protein RT97_00055 [Variovorax paradoxus]|uniref:Uncharacterized protein n=1 Tax=Variovorax paradoxus TaxID=34073 RepID=A0A0D0N8E7_VARPD|nr:hypothetical protein [Variovorax paradoxus]KIQ37520.1 hypothetical protein RT97_00055 [Variovorax paradoxus]